MTAADRERVRAELLPWIAQILDDKNRELATALLAGGGDPDDLDVLLASLHAQQAAWLQSAPLEQLLDALERHFDRDACPTTPTS